MNERHRQDPQQDRQPHEGLALWVNDLRIAMMLLTRIPMPSGAAAPTPQQTAHASWAFSLVGALIGTTGGVSYALATLIGFPPLLGGVVAVAMMIFATGAFHEDGFGDMVDGFAGGRTRDDKLAIMRDSRVGSYATIGLVLVLLARIGAIVEFAGPLGETAGDPWGVLTALIAAGAVSRAAIVWLAHVLPHARPDGQSAASGRPNAAVASIATAIAILLCLLLLSFPLLKYGLLGAAIGCIGVGLVAYRQIGGQTGDVLGAGQLMAEVGFLLGLVIGISP